MQRTASIVTFVLLILTASPVWADTFGTGANEFTIDFVPISGDAGDLGSWPAGSGYTFTGVNRDDYRMGTFEITNDQWTKFSASLGVPVTGDPSSAYDEDPYFTGTNVPTNEVSWYEAAQFVNWLNTSTKHQAAYKFTGTQGTSGYSLGVWESGDDGYDADNPYRNSNARYFMPTADEWLKAGYWNGTSLQTYATQPGDTLHQGDGVSGTGWNYYDNGYATDPYGPWDVGSGSEELNGTFDMMGNVWEWMESPYHSGDYGVGSRRGLRGGSFNGYVIPLASSSRFDLDPFVEVSYVGFRVASEVPGPDVDGDGVDDFYDVCDNTPAGTLVDAEGRPLGDIDQDCDTDLDDFALFQQGMTGPLAPPLVAIDTVLVGNPGNAGENSGESEPGGYGPDRICGAVDYVFNIGKFEVTAGQYTEFLNAVAATDTYGLYHTSMDSTYGCQITQNGTSGSYTYDFSGRPSGTEADWADRPVNYVSWGDAARFANWLHNGQPTGAQDLTTTEDGSYYLNGAVSDAELLAVAREPNATWVIPSEDEWYKAAYHYNDGVTGNYWDYPTKSDMAPTLEAPPGTDMTDGSANYYDSGYGIGSPYYRTEVGGYDAKPSDSPYGTFDQGGNVGEWNEAIFYGSYRSLRGGSFDDYNIGLRAANRNRCYDPTDEDNNIGFRVAEVP